MAKRKRRHPKRTPTEQASDAQKILRSKYAIDPNHWVTGVVGCLTCETARTAKDAGPLDPEAVAAEWDVDLAAVTAGIAKAKAAALIAVETIEQFPEMLERESEDLDSLGATGTITGHLPTGTGTP